MRSRYGHESRTATEFNRWKLIEPLLLSIFTKLCDRQGEGALTGLPSHHQKLGDST
jgi:hypothetical protein